MLITLIFVLFASLLIGYAVIFQKRSFLDSRDRSAKIIAEVIQYRAEKAPMRNDYTQLYYPYVRILSEGVDLGKVVRLKFANSWRKPFDIGEKVEVFWSGGELFYWSAFDRGIRKYIPANLPSRRKPERQ